VYAVAQAPLEPTAALPRRWGWARLDHDENQGRIRPRQRSDAGRRTARAILREIITCRFDEWSKGRSKRLDDPNAGTGGLILEQTSPKNY